jgi:hypothetical protein
MDTGGLLLAFTNPPADDEEAFNAWYDEEHAPARLGVPGILSARRYISVGADGPRYMACYDLETPDVLQRPEYVRLLAGQSDRERRMLARLPLLDKRILRTLIGGDEWTADPPYQVMVALDPPSGAEADFVTWYGAEHRPSLLRISGCRRVRLFEQVEGRGPRLMGLHEMESESVASTDAYQALLSELASRCRQPPEPRLFKLLRSCAALRTPSVATALSSGP